MLKEINQEMSLESVEKLMEDTADAIAYQEVFIWVMLVLILAGSLEFTCDKGYE